MSEVVLPAPSPAPWILKARNWSFVLSPLKSSANFPAGWAASYQAEALAKGQWAGSSGFVMVYSYSESPVDDELIYAPGNMKNEDGSMGTRITRIYVSSDASVYNGRKNWNVPKELADFKIEKQANGGWLIAVSKPGSSAPFFKAYTNPIPILSWIGVPLANTFSLSSPPLPQGENAAETGTDKWCTLDATVKGKARLVRFKAALEDGSGKAGDGINFPDSMIEDVIVDFPEAKMHDW
ncbi:hypothetical protein DL96DRAFT_1618167 [Flagelloscypha sp. PMI_526]|nr:hypothetical protein DL96DRAFT_1618167 [Flagelloscypha sp. PMI_526]